MCRVAGPPLPVVGQPLLHGIEQIGRGDGFGFARIDHTFAEDLAPIETVAQQVIEAAPLEDMPTAGQACAGGPLLGPNAPLFEIITQGADTAELQIALEDHLRQHGLGEPAVEAHHLSPCGA